MRLYHFEGYPEARRAVADKFSLPNAELEAKVTTVLKHRMTSTDLDLCTLRSIFVK